MFRGMLNTEFKKNRSRNLQNAFSQTINLARVDMR